MKLKLFNIGESKDSLIVTVVNPLDIFPNCEDSEVPHLYCDMFWDRLYLIRLTSADFSYLTNANHEQDAIDNIIDYLEEYQSEALLMSCDEMIEEEKDGFLDTYICGGNHGRYLNTLNVSIDEFELSSYIVIN